MHASLLQCELFKGLTTDKVSELIDSSSYTIEEYKEGEVIARRGTAYTGLMILLEGGVKGVRTSSGGRMLSTEIFHAPQLISPAFLFGGYNRLPIDVIASENVRMMILHRASLFQMMQENVIVLSNFIEIISNRANLLTKKLFFLSFESLKEKTVQYLLEHTQHNSREATDEKQLAAALEVRLDSLERVLHDLVQVGAVTVEEGMVRVCDRDKLQVLIKD